MTEKEYNKYVTPNLIYSKNGMKDSSGNVWLIALQPEKSSSYYVGKINEKDVTIEKITGDAVFEQEVLKVKKANSNPPSAPSPRSDEEAK